jgi:hypothetical protein
LRLKYLRRGSGGRRGKSGESNHKASHFGSRKDPLVNSLSANSDGPKDSNNERLIQDQS